MYVNEVLSDTYEETYLFILDNSNKIDEITVKDPYTEGRQYRTNPARFVKLNSYNTIDQGEAAKKRHYPK